MKGGIGMIYELRHFDDVLLRFSATEDTSMPEIELLWVNDEKKELMPLDLSLDEEGIASWLKHRTIPKNRAYVSAFLSKCGLSLNRPMNVISVSKGLSLNDCYWVTHEGFFYAHVHARLWKPSVLHRGISVFLKRTHSLLSRH